MSDEVILAKLTEHGLLDWYNGLKTTTDPFTATLYGETSLQFTRPQATYEEVDALVRAFSPKMCVITAALSTASDSIIVQLDL